MVALSQLFGLMPFGAGDMSPLGRSGHCAVQYGPQTMLVYGGQGYDANQQSWMFLGDLWLGTRIGGDFFQWRSVIYVPSVTGSASPSRSSAACAMVGDSLVVVGG